MVFCLKYRIVRELSFLLLIFFSYITICLYIKMGLYLAVYSHERQVFSLRYRTQKNIPAWLFAFAGMFFYLIPFVIWIDFLTSPDTLFKTILSWNMHVDAKSILYKMILHQHWYCNKLFYVIWFSKALFSHLQRKLSHQLFQICGLCRQFLAGRRGLLGRCGIALNYFGNLFYALL